MDAIQSQNAEIIIAGTVWDEAHQAALQFAEKTNAAYIPPFDHPLIWSGHSTLIDEVVKEGIKPDAVIAAVGGGGLACGILQGMHKHNWYEVPFFGAETIGAASFAAALKSDKLVSLPEIKTIATSLGAKRIAQKLFEWRKLHPLYPLEVTDAAAVKTCFSFLNDHRVLIEPSSAAALATIYELKKELTNYHSILVIVCGGIGISLDLLKEYLNEVNK